MSHTSVYSHAGSTLAGHSLFPRIPMPTVPRLLLALWAALLPMSGQAAIGDGDLVHLVNGHRLSGTVQDTGDPDHLTVLTPAGRLILSRRLVTQVEPGFETRRALLEADDYSGRMELVRWLLARDRKTDALALLRPVQDEAALDLEGLRLLARLIDELESPAEALPLYRRYAEAGGGDPGTLARLEQLETVERAWLQQVADREASIASIEVQEGMEVEGRWEPEDPRWSNELSVALVPARPGSSDQVLRLSYKAGASDRKAAVRWRRQLDVRPSPLLVFEAWNPESHPVDISVAVKVGQSWDYFESRPYRVESSGEWQRIQFDLSAQDFKSAASGWRHNAAVSLPSEIMELQIQIHNGSRAGNLFVNSIGFLPRP